MSEVVRHSSRKHGGKAVLQRRPDEVLSLQAREVLCKAIVVGQVSQIRKGENRCIERCFEILKRHEVFLCVEVRLAGTDSEKKFILEDGDILTRCWPVTNILVFID